MAKLAPSATGWTGRSGLTPYTVDVAAWVAALPSYDDTGHDKPTYAEIMARIDKFAPVYAVMGGTDPLGYRGLFPAGMGTDTDLYGQYTAANLGDAFIALIADSFTNAQKEAIATRLISQGIQWYDSYAATAGTTLDPNGGHFQFAFPCMAVALHATGRTADLATLRSRFGGNFRQYIAVDSTLAAKFVPHSSMNDPFTWRERNLDAISGTTFTLETRRSGDTGDATKFAVSGMAITNGTATTTITGLPGGEDVASSDPGSITVTVADASGFSVDDAVWFLPPVTPVVGQYEWSIHGNTPQYNPMLVAGYRPINQVSWAVLFLKAANIWNVEWDPVAGYVDAAARSNYPAASFDLPTPHRSSWAADFWADHADTIVGETQVPGAMAAPTVTAVNDTSISVDRAVAPNDGGSTITSYDLRWRTGAGAWTTVTGIADPQTVGSLTAETTYEVQTRAVNTNGAGPWSASGTVTTSAAASGSGIDEDASTGTFTSSGGYRIWTAADGDTLVVANAIDVNVLIVGGGGGGGLRKGGGGGAGEVVIRNTDNVALTAQTYTAVVGAGGPQVTAGSNSTFAGLTALGGGAGGSNGAAGGSGGSGGGAGSGSNTFGASTASDGAGNDGAPDNANSNGGGGGGGAGSAGASGGLNLGGIGGAGVASPVPGEAGHYGGGGGGGCAGDLGAGGVGGGGDGGASGGVTPIAGLVGTGGGGGGGGDTFGVNRDGASGGSGIIKVWWLE